MRNIPYWLNIGSILHQYGCATRVDLLTCYTTTTVAITDMSAVHCHRPTCNY